MKLHCRETHCNVEIPKLLRGMRKLKITDNKDKAQIYYCLKTNIFCPLVYLIFINSVYVPDHIVGPCTVR